MPTLGSRFRTKAAADPRRVRSRRSPSLRRRRSLGKATASSSSVIQTLAYPSVLCGARTRQREGERGVSFVGSLVGPTHDGPNVVERERERERKGGGGTDLHEGLPVLCFQVPSRQPVRVPVEVQGAHHDAADFGHSLQGVPKHGLELEIVLEPAVEGGNGSFGLRVVRDEDLQSGGPADRVP